MDKCGIQLQISYAEQELVAEYVVVFALHGTSCLFERKHDKVKVMSTPSALHAGNGNYIMKWKAFQKWYAM